MSPLRHLDDARKTKNTPQARQPAVTLQFARTPGNETVLRTVIVAVEETRAKIDLEDGHPALLTEDVITALAPHLVVAQSATHYQVQEFRLDLGALWLLGLVIEADQSLIEVSFQQAGGNPLAIFAPIEDVTTSSVNDLARAVDDAIERLYVPLTNLDTALDAVLDATDTTDISQIHREVLALKSDVEVAKFGFERALRDGTGERLRKTMLEGRHTLKS
jgi:hypothetical protein